MAVAAEEDVVRAFARTNGMERGPRPAFSPGRTSQSAGLQSFRFPNIGTCFRNHLEKPPERRLERIGEINVGRLQRIGRDYKKSIDLTVEAKPEDWNLAHAEIPQRITRGLANQIVNALRLISHRDESCAGVNGGERA